MRINKENLINEKATSYTFNSIYVQSGENSLYRIDGFRIIS